MPILSSEPSFYPLTLPVELGYEHSYEANSPESEALGLDAPETRDDSVETTTRRWWVVYTRSRQEKALARQLYGYKIPFYLPLVGQFHAYRGRKVRSYLPMFSGYLFLYGTDEERLMTLTTNRISRILPVDDQDCLRRDLLQVHRLIESDAPLTVEQRLEPGRPVRVKSGGLRGLEGQIIERRGKTRLLVMVQYIQQGVLVDIDDFMLEAL